MVWARQRSIKTADAINAIGGVPVSRYARELSLLWAEGRLTGEQMKQALLAYHRRLAANSKTAAD